MPWQLSGNGRSDWSTKLIRGLKAEAAAGFQSRRERCREPTPATPQYAAFSTYKAARVHHDCGRCCGRVAIRIERAASTGDWVPRQLFVRCPGRPDCVPPGFERNPPDSARHRAGERGLYELGSRPPANQVRDRPHSQFRSHTHSGASGVPKCGFDASAQRGDESVLEVIEIQ
jgi:hypothetical protein